MCGIAAAIGWNDAEAIVQVLLEGLRHRGEVTDPVLRLAPRLALGTRRLPIVDPEQAVQPQASFDNRILVVFNGEIYNHAELRDELRKMGIAFRSRSDTEVLASALRVWGPGALQRINGMYAFVAVDAQNGEFVAGRDPLGVKPLYLIQHGQGFLFCSEMRPLLNATEAGDVLLVPPGHLLTRTELVKFGSFVADDVGQPREQGPETLDGLLSKAVDIRLPDGLPVATMFSGGIDSVLVTHYARQTRPDIPGYFLGDEDSPDYAYAARYADMTGLDMRRVPLADEGETLMTHLDAVVSACEAFEPAVVRNGLCNFLLARRMREDGFRVALCGEGADELFAGYKPLEVAFQEGEAIGRNVQSQTLAIMHKTNLQRLDRLGMRFQLEIREPFLDLSLIRYALGLRADQLVTGNAGELRGKIPLREIWALYPNALPVEIRDRCKTAMHVGAGLDLSQRRSPWIEHAEAAVSDQDFQMGKVRFAPFAIGSKEELLYIDRLTRDFDVFRVPHLMVRPHLRLPGLEASQANVEALSDFLAEV